MRYEIMLIFKPTLSEEELEQSIEKYRNILSDKTSKVVDSQKLGNKELAYEINNFKSGYYHLYEIDASDDSATRELDRVASISDDVIRHLITRKGD